MLGLYKRGIRDPGSGIRDSGIRDQGPRTRDQGLLIPVPDPRSLIPDPRLDQKSNCMLKRAYRAGRMAVGVSHVPVGL